MDDMDDMDDLESKVRKAEDCSREDLRDLGRGNRCISKYKCTGTVPSMYST